MKSKIGIGIIGIGTVGSGVIEILLRNADIIKRRIGVPLEIVRAVTKDTSRPLPEGLNPAVVGSDATEVIDNPDVDIVVELMGGVEPAKSFTLRAIENGKHIVTANKALLSLSGDDLYRAASQKGVDLYYEASVCGGIPIIKALREGLSANRIESMYGIVNGTSNFIMTKMTQEGKEFKDALKDAQGLGYAEADPTYDVEGIDAAHKLSILVNIAFGTPVNLKDVYTEGISGIQPLDIEYAEELKYRVKLLAISKMKDGRIEARVHPTFVPCSHLISTVDGAFNAVYVTGDAVGHILFYGRGAGSLPTGSAVAGDIIDVARNILNNCCGRIPPASFKEEYRMPLNIMSIDDIVSMYYFRFTVIDMPGVLSKIAGILGDHKISIASVIQKGRKEGGEVPLVMLTHEAVERNVKDALKEISGLHFIANKTVMIRVEEGQ
ncbi:MAG: homoserine dehydrogenase [Nitrospirae bacterium]|nr:homoserine dehydrogenase [Nitrospirota bacterium]